MSRDTAGSDALLDALVDAIDDVPIPVLYAFVDDGYCWLETPLDCASTLVGIIATPNEPSDAITAGILGTDRAGVTVWPMFELWGPEKRREVMAAYGCAHHEDLIPGEQLATIAVIRIPVSLAAEVTRRLATMPVR